METKSDTWNVLLVYNLIHLCRKCNIQVFEIKITISCLLLQVNPNRSRDSLKLINVLINNLYRYRNSFSGDGNTL